MTQEPPRHDTSAHPGRRFRSWFTQAHTIHRVVQIDARRVLVSAFWWALGFALLLAIPFLLYYQSEAQSYREMRQAEKERVIRLASEIIHQEMEAAQADLRFISRNNEMAAFLARDTPENRAQIAREFLELASQKELYDQVRLIGADGRELVRVNYGDGRPYVVPERELQFKGERPYFPATMALDAASIHVSPFELNVEHGQLERPYKPVVRLAVPVVDGQGRKRGIVILNYLGQRLLDRLAVVDGMAGLLWLVDARGYWLLGPQSESAWGFAVPGREDQSLSASNPLLWRAISGANKGEVDEAGTGFQFERIYPFAETPETSRNDLPRPRVGKEYHWTVVTQLSAEFLRQGLSGLVRNLALLYGIWVASGCLLAAALSFLVTRNSALSHVMENVIDSLPVLISYVDAERRYRFNNMAYERFFGLSPKQLFGKTMREVLGDASYEEVRPHVDRALAGEVVTLELHLPYARAGERDVVVSYIPDVGVGGRVLGFYVLVSDVSQIRDSERRERQRMLELAHVSRLASLGEMASEIAHEVNQPLAAIAMYSAACLRTLGNEPGDGQMQDWLQAINAQAKRASEVVSRLRRFVRKRDIHPGPVDLNQVAREGLALMRFECARQGVAVDLELDGELPSLSAELILVEQVLFNLLRNALDALLHRTDGKRVVIRTGHGAGHAWIEVEDNGPGVDPALGDRVFESFMTDKPDGMGVGLAISRSIVQAHGGSLGYVNNPGEGATFRCTLPREVGDE